MNDGNKNAMQSGLEVAVAQVNALGGILGRTVQVSAMDDMGEPATALTVAQTLVGKDIAALLGPVNSGEVSMVEPYITMEQLVETSSTATSIDLSSGYGPRKGFFFRTVPSDAYQAIAVALFALEGPTPDAGVGTCTKMDVVHTNDTYGNPLATGIETYFKAHGGSVPSDIPIPTNPLGSYLTQVMQVISDVPDCVVLGMYEGNADQFMHDLSDQINMSPLPTGWQKSFFVIGTDGTYDPSLITSGRASASDPASQSWVNGTYGPQMYGTVAYSSNHDRQQYNDLLALYVAEVGLMNGVTDMDPYTSNQYDAAILEMLAMEAAGTTTNGPAIQQAMFDVSRGKNCSAAEYGPATVGDAINAAQSGTDINYEGASGNVDFNDYGDVIGDFLIWHVQGSGFTNFTTISSIKLAANNTADAGGCQ